MIPELLWPDWSARLLASDGYSPDRLRALLSVALLIPGHPEGAFPTHAAQLNPDIRSRDVAELLQRLTSATTIHPDPVLTVLCRIAEHLDRQGSPIDYQRRREHIPTQHTITWSHWRELACAHAEHPGDQPDQGRHLHVQRYLCQLLTGADLTDASHPLNFRRSNDHSAYYAFTAGITPRLRHALLEHAATLLADVDIVDEPTTWSPPAALAEGQDLPGIEPDLVDLDALGGLVHDQHRPLGEATRTLGIHIEHARFALERLDQKPRSWAKSTPPAAWQRRQNAANTLNHDFFDREHLRRGRSLTEFGETTGHGRHLVTRLAKEAGITPPKGKAPFRVDAHWLREQYCDRLRATSDIATELGISQMMINLALRRFGIPARPQGVASFPEMLDALDADTPRDIRAAVEGRLRGWLRLHRFHIAMRFPSIKTAATYLGAPQTALTHQFHRLEDDIGTPLFERSSPAARQRPTPRGGALLEVLDGEQIQQLMRAGLRDDEVRPPPDADDIARAHREFERPPQTRRPPAAYNGIALQRVRITEPLKTLLGDVLAHHPQESYGAAILEHTGLVPGTLYPMLHRLTAARWLTSRPESEQSWLARAPVGRGPGRRRTYYTLTAEGIHAARHELDHQRPLEKAKRREIDAVQGGREAGAE